MALFNKKKPAAPSAAPAVKPVNPDDIWNTPSPRRKQTVTVKESKYDEAVPETLEVESVDPEMIKTKMAQLEAELEEKKNQPVKTHADYGTSTVGREEIVDAQTEYEKLYEVEHEKYIRSHQEEITEAKEQGIAEKMEAMYAEHEAKVAEILSEAGYDIYQQNKLKSISELEKLVGRQKLNELIGIYIIKPEGNPILVKEKKEGE